MEIREISIENYKTLVEFKYVPTKDSRIYISGGTYIKDYKNTYGAKYMITGFQGNELDKIYNVSKGESYVIVLEFEKLPKGITNIEIREPQVSGDWNPWYWSNIKINNPLDIYNHYKIGNNEYSIQTLNSGYNQYWKYYIPAGTMAVFTLKNNSSTSDFDIFVYSDKNHDNLLKSGENNGTKTEMVVMPVYEYGKYVYLKIKNYGDYSSKYKVNAHHVDLAGLAEDALIDAGSQYLIEEGIKWIFGVEDDNDDQSSHNISRASNLILSVLKEEDFAGTSRNLLINELTETLRTEFGFGFWGNLMVSYGVNVISETYKYY